MKNLVVQQLLSGNTRRQQESLSVVRTLRPAPRKKTPFGNENNLFSIHKRLVVEERLGVSSSFHIYDCTDPVADERVLIKVLTADEGSSAELGFEIEITQLIERGANYGLCLSSRGRSELGPYYAVNGDKEAALAFMLGNVLS